MTQESQTLITLFGATGDLAARKLYPALFSLYKKKELSQNFALIGTGRREWTTEKLQSIVRQSIQDDDQALIEEFSSHFYYQSHDATNGENYTLLKDLADELDEKYNIGGNRLFYLSVAPFLFSTITGYLREYDLFADDAHINRVIFEKPFGTDLASAKQLKEELLEHLDRDEIYLIDHYLGKEIVKNLLTLRFANPLINNVWHKDAIANVQITLAEKVGVEERGEFYDKTGALKDMVQNHILQCFSYLAMEQPKSLDTADILQAKVDALRNIKSLDDSALHDSIVRAQYVADEQDTAEESYRENKNVDSQSETETYVAGTLYVDNDLLEGVPFYYRTGKKMADKTTRFDIVFKNQEDSIFDNAEQNVLTIHLGPKNGFSLCINEKEIGYKFGNSVTTLNNFRTDEQLEKTPDDYERLIFEAIQGNQINFAQYDEVIASWKYIDQVKSVWEDSDDLTTYDVYSKGPKEADDLLTKDGHNWIW